MSHRLLLAVLALLVSISFVRAEEPAKTDEPVTAESSHASRVVEEIVVTAQKTAQNIRDVPISMSAIDNKFIADQGISDFGDLARFVPNAAIDISGAYPDIRIRGLGSEVANKTFEQPVSLVIDGIPYGRTPYWLGPLFDLERVEVLRGPQGTLFGKNTTGGAVNVITAKPTDDFAGYVSLTFGNYARRNVEAAVGGPLKSGLVDFRIATIIDEQDGLVRNTTAGGGDQRKDRDRKGVRAQLSLPNLFGGSMTLGYEHVEVNMHPNGWETSTAVPNETAFYRRYDPNYDIDPDNYRGSVDAPETLNIKMDGFVANLDYDIADWRLHATAGYSMLKFFSFNDADFTPAPQITVLFADDNPLTTTELRLQSPRLTGFLGLERLFGLDLGDSDLLGGFFFQRQGLKNSRTANVFDFAAVGALAGAQGVPANNPLAATIGSIFGEAALLGTLPSSAATKEGAASLVNQTTQSLAGFSNFNWHPVNRLTLATGFRFTFESKDIQIQRVCTTPSCLALETALGWQEYVANLSRDESAFTPKVSANYAWTDDINTYASWTRGFKAGGFNELSFTNTPSNFSYQPEKTTAWEVGSKMRLLDGTATLNAALFWQNITNLQVFVIPPGKLVPSVKNAGEGRVRGVELDGTWLPTDWLTLIATGAFTDSEFLSFPFGECPADAGVVGLLLGGICNDTGKPFFRTPKWASTLVANVRYPTSSIPGIDLLPLLGVDVIGSFGSEYKDVQYTTRSYEPQGRQPSFFRFDTSLGLANSKQGWSAKIAVKNLTDEPVALHTRGQVLGAGSFVHILDYPRLVMGTVEYRF